MKGALINELAANGKIRVRRRAEGVDDNGNEVIGDGVVDIGPEDPEYADLLAAIELADKETANDPDFFNRARERIRQARENDTPPSDDDE